MPKKSGTVSAGQQATALQHNDVRDDALNLFAETGIELTIAGGVVTIAGNYSTFYDIDTQGDASSDDLDTINGAEDGEIIVLRAEHTDRTVVVKHNTGNILLQGGQDHALANTNQLLMLRYFGTATKWLEVAGGADRLVVFGYSLGNGEALVLVDTYGDIPYMPGVYLLGLYGMANASGGISIDIRTETFGTIPDSADSIGTSPCFVMSGQQTKSDATLAGITREQAAGCWRFIVTVAASTIKQVAIIGLGVRT